MPLTREQNKFQNNPGTYHVPGLAVNNTLGVLGNARFTGPTNFTNGLTVNSLFLIDLPGGQNPNFIMRGDGEQTFRFHNTATAGSTRVSWKMANRLNSDWSWIWYTDSLSNGTNDITLANLTSNPVLRITADSQTSLASTLTIGGQLNLNYASPTISSNNASTASLFTSTVTGITIGSSTIKTTMWVADGTTSSAAEGHGYMGMPRGNSGNAITGAYTITAADAGKHLYVTTTGQTVTIPTNATTALPIGTTIVIINGNGVSTSIALATDTLRLANTATTGSPRTLASNGMCTLVKINTTEWLVGGNGIS